MSKNKHWKFTEPLAIAAQEASDLPSDIEFTIDIEPTVDIDKYLILVDDVWMSSFSPLRTTDEKSEAMRMDYDSAVIFAKHLEFRRKGKCEVLKDFQ